MFGANGDLHWNPDRWQPKGKVLEANAFILTDESGKKRAQLGLSDSDDPGILLLDQNGHVRVMFVVGDDGTAGAAIYDATGRIRAEFTVLPDGSPLVSVFRANRKAKVVMGAMEPGPAIALFGENGKPSAGLIAVDGHPHATLCFYDQAGNVILSLPENG